MKEEIFVPESDNLLIEQTNNHLPVDHVPLPVSSDHSDDFNYESFRIASAEDGDEQRVEVSLFPDFKDGSSDSDSSATCSLSDQSHRANSHARFHSDDWNCY